MWKSGSRLVSRKNIQYLSFQFREDEMWTREIGREMGYNSKHDKFKQKKKKKNSISFNLFNPLVRSKSRMSQFIGYFGSANRTKDCTNVLHGIDKSLRITLYHAVSKRSRNPRLFSSLSSRFLEHPIRSDFRKSKKRSLLGTLVNTAYRSELVRFR